MAGPLINAAVKPFIIITAAKQYAYLKFHTYIRNKGNLAYHYKKDSQVFHCPWQARKQFRLLVLCFSLVGIPQSAGSQQSKRSYNLKWTCVKANSYFEELRFILFLLYWMGLLARKGLNVRSRRCNLRLKMNITYNPKGWKDTLKDSISFSSWGIVLIIFIAAALLFYPIRGYARFHFHPRASPGATHIKAHSGFCSIQVFIATFRYSLNTSVVYLNTVLVSGQISIKDQRAFFSNSKY